MESTVQKRPKKIVLVPPSQILEERAEAKKYKDNYPVPRQCPQGLWEVKMTLTGAPPLPLQGKYTTELNAQRAIDLFRQKTGK